jgi:hypothetical protein
LADPRFRSSPFEFLQCLASVRQDRLRPFLVIHGAAKGIVAQMLEVYGGWGNLRTHWYSAEATIARKDK